MSVITNKFSGRSKAKSDAPLLKPLMILAMVLIGIFSFAALIVLMGYGDDLRQKESGGATPVSQSAIGYAGYVQLLEGIGFDVEMDAKPYEDSYQTRQRIRIYSPANSFMGAKFEGLDDDAPKLIIAPKWMVTPMKDKTGWVRKHWASNFMRARDLSLIIGEAGNGVFIHHIAPEDIAGELRIELGKTDPINAQIDLDGLQYFSVERPKIEIPEKDEDEDSDEDNNEDSNSKNGTIEKVIDMVSDLTETEEPNYTTLMSGPENEAILIKLEDSRTYVLSDPDFLNTQGIATESRARLAVDIIQTIIKHEELDPRSVTFDLSIHGIESKPNLVKLMTQPPFLAATLCLLAAGGLIAWQGFARFGDPVDLPADYSQGPASLAKTSAGFLASAKRLGSMGDAYAQLTRRQVIRRLGLTGQSTDIIAQRLNAREKLRNITPEFEQLKHIPATQDAMGFTARAQALVKWKKEMLREH